MFTATKFEGLRQTGSAHRELVFQPTGSFRTQASHASFPRHTFPGTTRPRPCDSLNANFANSQSCRKREGEFVTRSMQSNEMQRLIVHVACLNTTRGLTFALQLCDMKTIPDERVEDLTVRLNCRLLLKQEEKEHTVRLPHFSGTFHSIDAVRKHTVSNESKQGQTPSQIGFFPKLRKEAIISHWGTHLLLSQFQTGAFVPISMFVSILLLGFFLAICCTKVTTQPTAFARLRLCVGVVLTLVTSVVIETSFISAGCVSMAIPQPRMFCVCLMLLFVTSSEFFTVCTLFFLCNLFLFDVRESRLRPLLGSCLVPGLLHKFLLLFHSSDFTLCCVCLDTPLCFARFVSLLACDAACRFSVQNRLAQTG